MILFVDASAGLSGDMLLSGLLDLGFPLEKLRRILRLLGLDPVAIHPRRIRREGLDPVRLSIRGGRQGIPHRAGDLIRFVEDSAVDSSLKRLLVQALVTLGRAEGIVHRRPWTQAHFHQLGQADTLVDLGGLCAGLLHFKVRTVYTSSIPLGSRHQDPHGKWRSRPGPATQWLLRDFQTRRLAEGFEWSTPTGAAFLSTFASPEPPPPFRVVQIGHGVGRGRPPRGPRVLRLLLGEPI